MTKRYIVICLLHHWLTKIYCYLFTCSSDDKEIHCYLFTSSLVDKDILLSVYTFVGCQRYSVICLHVHWLTKIYIVISIIVNQKTNLQCYQYACLVDDFVREEVNRLEQSDMFLDVYLRDSYNLIDEAGGDTTCQPFSV